MIGCGAIDRYMRAGRIVRDHAADRRARARGDIGTKAKPVRLKKLVQLIQNNPRSGANRARFQIQFGDLTIVAREFDDHSISDRSATQTAPSAAWRDRSTGIGGRLDDRAGLPCTAWKRNCDGRELIERSVGGVELPRQIIVYDLAISIGEG